MDNKNFGIIGVGGYIAPRHLNAIKENNGNLVAAYDPKDSVGIIDSFGDDVKFFTEFERFDRFVDKIKRKCDNFKLDYISICSPNYLHDSHIRFALKNGANAICEKPLVLNPWNLDALKDLEKETGKKVYNILQLRVHPKLIELKNKISNSNNSEKYEIDLNYITSRGNWYFVSWKGSQEKSGGIASNIGIHFFDMLIWIFGEVESQKLFYKNEKAMSGFIELKNAKVKWYLSIDKNDLPLKNREENKAYRSITVNGEEIEFSGVFKDLHTLVYEDILNGKGYGLDDVKPAIDLVYKIRNSEISEINLNEVHEKALEKLKNEKL